MRIAVALFDLDAGQGFGQAARGDSSGWVMGVCLGLMLGGVGFVVAYLLVEGHDTLGQSPDGFRTQSGPAWFEGQFQTVRNDDMAPYLDRAGPPWSWRW